MRFGVLPPLNRGLCHRGELRAQIAKPEQMDNRWILALEILRLLTLGFARYRQQVPLPQAPAH
jgi:hypothetical protein